MTIPKVSLEAREAAADLFLAEQGEPFSPHDRRIEKELRSGELDDWDSVQSFAQFEQLIRSKVIEEAAGVAETIAASNDAAERKHHNEARASTSLSGHATALEYAVGFAKSARTAREIALAIRQLGERGR